MCVCVCMFVCMYVCLCMYVYVCVWVMGVSVLIYIVYTHTYPCSLEEIAGLDSDRLMQAHGT